MKIPSQRSWPQRWGAAVVVAAAAALGGLASVPAAGAHPAATDLTPMHGDHLTPRLLASGSEGAAGSASSAGQEMIALRQRYFGDENVDDRTGAVRRDRVVLSWFGVTNFAMAIGGHVVLLDAWVPRGGTTGYVPSSPAELAALRPEAIFIGHAHFDHAADAVPIAQASGAALVGSAEHCEELLSRVDRATMPPRCIAGLPAGVDPGTTRGVDVLRGVSATIVKSLHSAVKRPDGDDTGGYHVPVLPAPSTTQLEHPPTPRDLLHIVGGLPDAEAGTVLYRFRVGDFSVVWNDSAGPLKEEAPLAYDRLRELRPVDVHIGAIQSFGQVSNGMRDTRLLIEAVGAPLFVPSHHDDWAAGITTKGAGYRKPLDDELRRIPARRRPKVRFLFDPADYVRPSILTFPVAFEPVRLSRRCLRGGRLHLRIDGDVTDVRSVQFRVGARRIDDDAAPYAATVSRRRPGRLRAVVTTNDGTRLALRRARPSCVRRSSARAGAP